MVNSTSVELVELRGVAMDGGSSGEEWLQQVVVEGKRKGKAGSCYKRRFNDDQVRSLETMFEEEAKLEPRKKVQLAKELGLQPRQVAIWFQNRRARWKSKQLEREYNALLTSFDGLAQSFDSLEMEKQSLLKQVGKLKEELLEKKVEEGKSSENCFEVVRAKTPNCKETDHIVSTGEGAEQSTGLNCLSLNEENSLKSMESFGLESNLMLNIEPADSAPIVGRTEAWLEEWGTDLDSGNFSDQSCCTMEWWDVWA